MEIMSRSSLSSIFHHFFKSSWNPSEKINSINHDNRIFLFQEGLDLLYLVWIVNCQTDCGLKMEPHPGLDSLSPPDTMFILATSHASSLPEVSVPPPDMRAHPCSTIKVSTHKSNVQNISIAQFVMDTNIAVPQPVYRGDCDQGRYWRSTVEWQSSWEHSEQLSYWTTSLAFRHNNLIKKLCKQQ